MTKKYSIYLVTFLLTIFATHVLASGFSTKPDTVHWEIQGDLTETCSCAVPCTCNFGEGPSPKHYCHTMFSLAIEKGHYGDVKLDSLHLAGVHGNKSKVWYIDSSATPDQAAALRAIADHILKSDHVEAAAIKQKVGDKSNLLKIGDEGGFEADYIMGLDKKTPVVVENNTTWNVHRSIKAKSKYVHYRDEFGNKLEFKGTNSNEGKFDWSDQTGTYF
ncbi:MAG TPA: DUF1326 domain-containing protein [Terriglobia bacterium]|nr:DUF1326 domain-containing protein [Terriglobia bacterium]